MTLLTRTTRNVAVTDPGWAVYERCLRIVAEVDVQADAVADQDVISIDLARGADLSIDADSGGVTDDRVVVYLGRVPRGEDHIESSTRVIPKNVVLDARRGGVDGNDDPRQTLVVTVVRAKQVVP